MDYNAVDRIFEAVETVTGVSRATILSPTRRREVFFARAIVAHHLRAQGLSLMQVAELVGVTGHASVVHQCRCYRDEQTPSFRYDAEAVEKFLLNN